VFEPGETIMNYSKSSRALQITRGLIGGVALVAALSGCSLLGSSSPPAKTYIVIPQAAPTSTLPATPAS
jgi:hypothetical protein